jgi:hypothetical protein
VGRKTIKNQLHIAYAGDHFFSTVQHPLKHQRKHFSPFKGKMQKGNSDTNELYLPGRFSLQSNINKTLH